mgnify:CR=1 FL=1
MVTLTQEIKEYALSIGFAKVGITDTEEFTPFIKELRSRGEYYKYWQESLGDGAKIQERMPEGKSLIVLAYDYGQHSYPKELTNMIGRAYLSRSYLPLPDSVNGAMLNLFDKFLEQKNIHFVRDNNTIPMRWAAAKSGVANFGKNNFAYVDGVGSFVILYGYVVDCELEYDEPSFENKCPKGCTKCVDACPTKALYEPFHLNPSKCIGFNNWKRREGKVDEEDLIIPEEIRGMLGCHIHGCDVCQEVCPRNQGKVSGKMPKDRFVQHIARDITLPALLHMTDEFYQTRVHPIMHNYIKDKIYFQRNAAIAMGNSGDKSYIPDLKQELSNPSGTVRMYVEWALKQLEKL